MMELDHFQWHPEAMVQFPAENLPFNALLESHYVDANNVCIIFDKNCRQCFNDLEYAIKVKKEFCIYPIDSSVDDNASKNQAFTTDAPEFFGNDAAIFFQSVTAGSQGKPKRIRRTQASWLACFSINAKAFNINSLDSYAILGRLSHSLSLYATLEASNIGANIHVLSDLRADYQVKALLQLESTILYATPTQLRLLYQHYKKQKISPINSVRLILSGGGKLDITTAKNTREMFHHAILVEFYGATETSFITLSDEKTPQGSVGKAYPNVQIRIDNFTDDQQGGEIWIKSPYLFEGYIDQGDLPIQQQPQWKEDYIHLGEYGYLDKNGYLFLLGRQSRRVNIADQLVYPEEVETLLLQYQQINHCAVVPISDKKRGQVLVAVIETDRGTDKDNHLTIKQLLRKLRQQLGPLKAPRDIVIASIPKLASGKVNMLAVHALLSSHYNEKNIEK